MVASYPPRKYLWVTKKICDPAKLKVFKTLKEQARRALQNVGLPLLGGYAVPLDEFDNVRRS